MISLSVASRIFCNIALNHEKIFGYVFINKNGTHGKMNYTKVFARSMLLDTKDSYVLAPVVAPL